MGEKEHAANVKSDLSKEIYTQTKSIKEMLEKMGLSDEWRLACHSKVHTDITIEAEESEMRIQSDDNLFKFKPEKGYGIAVDLGSTTIVATIDRSQQRQNNRF